VKHGEPYIYYYVLYIVLLYTTKRVVCLMCGVNRVCHTNVISYRYRILKFNDLVDLKILSNYYI